MGLNDVNPQIEGGTDGTIIGNIADRLKIDGRSSDIGDTGTLTDLNSTVEVSTEGMSSVIFFTSGTWVGTIRAEGFYGDDSTWTLLTATDSAQNVFATQTVNSRWAIACGGFRKVRLRMSSYTSGTATVLYNSANGSGVPLNVWNTNAASFKNTPRSDSFTVTGSAAALNANLVASSDLAGYQGASVQITGTYVGTITFQGSNDNSNFVSVYGTDISTKTSATTTNTTGIYWVPLFFRYFRVRMTVYVSGTATSTTTYETISTNHL